MILIAAIFLIAIVLMGASFDAMKKERNRYDRANHPRSTGHFASL